MKQKIISEQDLNQLQSFGVDGLTALNFFNSLPSAQGDDSMSKYVVGVEENEPTPLAALAWKNTELAKRIEVLEDLLSSAYNIANRNGENTHWLRFCAQLHINGVNPVTAKTFKILPSDAECTTPQLPPDAAARIAELEAEVSRWKQHHEHEVSRGRLLKCRTDIPLEIKNAYDRCALDNVERLESENAKLKADRAALVEATDKLVQFCEDSNKRCIDQIGIGLIDVVTISKTKALLSNLRGYE